jgi:hypothetical protein
LTYLYHTVPVYDGRKSRLRVPEDLSKIPDVLPRYEEKILEDSLALVAYTVSTYAGKGARKDQDQVNLHIHYAVLLSTEKANNASGNEEGNAANE